MNKTQNTEEGYIPINPNEIARERRVVHIRDVQIAPSKFDETVNVIELYKDIVNLETGEVIYTAEFPMHRINVRVTEEGHVRKNSVWGRFISEVFPNVIIAGTNERGIGFEKSPVEYKGAVVTEEKQEWSFGKDLEPVDIWVPVIFHGQAPLDGWEE